MQVGMVIDLTNTSKYYNFHKEIPDADKRGIFYRKARMKELLSPYS